MDARKELLAVIRRELDDWIETLARRAADAERRSDRQAADACRRAQEAFQADFVALEGRLSSERRRR